jgi:hypothetical protein
MRGHRRFVTTGAVLVAVVLAVVFLTAGPAGAEKPPPPPPPDPVDGGLIYYSTGNSACSMKPDGSEDTPLDVSVYGDGPGGSSHADPSRKLHACTDSQHGDPERWFVVVRPYGTTSYPNGVARREIFAVSECGEEVRLTDAADIEPDHMTVEPPVEAREFFSRPRWFDGDTRISYLAKRWSSGSVVEWGLYVLMVDAGGPANHAPARPSHLPVTMILRRPEMYGGKVHVNYTWSPNGTALVYERETYQGLWRADHVDGVWNQVPLIAGNFPDWAPNTPRVMFKYDRDLYSMDPYQPGGKTLVVECPENTKRWHYHLGKSSWSPNGTHFAYQMTSQYVFKNAGGPWIVDVHRAAADGSGQTNLTGDVEGWANLLGWR